MGRCRTLTVRRRHSIVLIILDVVGTYALSWDGVEPRNSSLFAEGSMRRPGAKALEETQERDPLVVRFPRCRVGIREEIERPVGSPSERKECLSTRYIAREKEIVI